jgi:hypothetical protein
MKVCQVKKMRRNEHEMLVVVQQAQRTAPAGQNLSYAPPV